MNRIKILTGLTVLSLLAVSCHERKGTVRDTIPYVKQLAVDTAGTFSLVHAYRNAGTEGSIAILGEPEAALELAAQFLSADRCDNIDGKLGADRLPDFAGETFDVLMDLFNAPYGRLAASAPDSLREVAARNAVMVVDTVAYSNALDMGTRLRKSRAKVFILASSLMEKYGRFDVDTLFRMAGRQPLILTPVQALYTAAVEQGCKQVVVWSSEESVSVYDSLSRRYAPGVEVSVCSVPVGDDPRAAFRTLLRQVRTRNPRIVVDAVLLDSYLMNLPALEAELVHIRRQITEEDLSFDRMLSPDFHFIDPESSLTLSCYRLLRQQNLFTHNIAYPSARYYQTEEGPDGDYVMVEVGVDYLESHVPDHH